MNRQAKTLVTGSPLLIQTNKIANCHSLPALFSGVIKSAGDSQVVGNVLLLPTFQSQKFCGCQALNADAHKNMFAHPT